MPVPSSISDLSTTPALNSPPGSESPSSIDDYLRTLSAFIRQINDLAATKADDSALSSVVNLTGAQTVAGTKTFSASPVVPDATAPKHPVTKDQLDAKAPIASPAFTGVPTAPNPTAGTRSQALATMQMFAGEFAASLATNGYQKLPNGLIIQWGIGAAVVNNVSQNIVFPISFPTTCFGVYAQPYRPTSTIDDVFSSVSEITPSQFTATMSLTAGTFAPMWFAMGC